MVAQCTLRRFRDDERAASGLEYGIIGGVMALLLGLVFLQIGPHLASIMAAAVRHLSGIHSAE